MRLLLLISFFIAYNSYAEFKCIKEGKIKYIRDSKEFIEKSSYCIDHIHYKILSFDCLRDENCLAKKSYIGSKKLNIINSVGTPADNKCFILGGKASLVSFYNGSDFEKTSICRFKDKSFVSSVNSFN